MYRTHYYTTIKRIGLLIGIYFLCRVFFYAVNYNFFSEANSESVVYAFLHGLRFDLSIIFSSNALFIACSILPLSIRDARGWNVFLKVLYVGVNIPLLFMNLADVEYFKFSHKRTGFDTLGILGDVQDQSIQLAFHYWYIPVLSLLLVLALIKAYSWLEQKGTSKVQLKYAWLLYVPVICITILIIRGGFQYRPLQPDHAFVLRPNILGNLVLNTPYNFFTTMTFPRAETIKYFATEKEVYELLKHEGGAAIDTTKPKVNVVIIILESFSREYMSRGRPIPGFMPFLDSLSNEGTFFDHHFANGRKSIDAVPAIFASIPSMMDEPFITGIYQSNEIHGLAEVVSKHHYHTSFFHGGKNGTMGFDKFSKNAGFQYYYGLDEYPTKDRDFDGNWGIYDEPYLQYFSEQLSTFEQPFLSSVFTLSSHQPFSIPPQYKGKFKKGYVDVHECMQYTDYALKRFFETAKKQDWYSNTLFVITADHTYGLYDSLYRSTIGEHRVPLLLFQPGKKIEADTSQVSQHLDIMPTVLEYAGIENPTPILFGRSLFSKEEGRAYFFGYQNYTYVKKDYFLELNNFGTFLFDAKDWKHLKNIKDAPLAKQQYVQELKAYIQYHNNGLNENSWYRYINQ